MSCSVTMVSLAWKSYWCLTGLLLAVLNPFRFHPVKWQVKIRRAYFESEQMRSSLMLWDAASCRVMRMAAISAYCDNCGPKLNCRGGQGSLLSQTTPALASKFPLRL